MVCPDHEARAADIHSHITDHGEKGLGHAEHDTVNFLGNVIFGIGLVQCHGGGGTAARARGKIHTDALAAVGIRGKEIVEFLLGFRRNSKHWA